MIEAVVVCVDYADFLAETLPLLATHVDRVAVVSSEGDSEAAAVVNREPNALLVTTDVFWRDGGNFRKGAAINVGLRQLAQTGWVLHIDADIAMVEPVSVAEIDRDCLWTARRMSIRGKASWDRFRAEGIIDQPHFPDNFHQRTPCVPRGYFQLWHAPTQPRSYPEESRTAANDDMVFSHSFQRRGILQSPIVYHLESENHKKSANWRGRKTERFA